MHQHIHIHSSFSVSVPVHGNTVGLSVTTGIFTYGTTLALEKLAYAGDGSR